jgi:ubiquitin C-terminal hydrolase
MAIALNEFMSTHDVHKFKSVVDKFTDAFAIQNSEHDIDEFLTFLIESLHEAIGSSSQLITDPLPGRNAALAWATFKVMMNTLSSQNCFYISVLNCQTRHQSAVIDLFYGLLRIEYTCPDCSFTCTKFEPYPTLKLPIPV